MKDASERQGLTDECLGLKGIKIDTELGARIKFI